VTALPTRYWKKKKKRSWRGNPLSRADASSREELSKAIRQREEADFEWNKRGYLKDP